MAEEVVNKVEEVIAKAETIRSLANEIYYAMKDVQRFIAEKRAIEEEPDWHLLDVLVTRTYRGAIEITRDMNDVINVMRRLTGVSRGG